MVHICNMKQRQRIAQWLEWALWIFALIPKNNKCDDDPCWKKFFCLKITRWMEVFRTINKFLSSSHKIDISYKSWSNEVKHEKLSGVQYFISSSYCLHLKKLCIIIFIQRIQKYSHYILSIQYGGVNVEGAIKCITYEKSF